MQTVKPNKRTGRRIWVSPATIRRTVDHIRAFGVEFWKVWAAVTETVPKRDNEE